MGDLYCTAGGGAGALGWREGSVLRAKEAAGWKEPQGWAARKSGWFDRARKKLKKLKLRRKSNRRYVGKANLPPPGITEQASTFLESQAEGAISGAGQLLDRVAKLADSARAGIEMTWNDPAGVAWDGVSGYYTGLAGYGVAYVDHAIDHFGGMLQADYELKLALIDDFDGTIMALVDKQRAVVVNDVVTVLTTASKTGQLVGDGECSSSDCQRAKVIPLTYSIATKSCPSCSPTSNTGTTFGWLSFAIACASRSIRFRAASDSGPLSSLSASRRSSLSSKHAYTVPIPPSPSTLRIA